jgi:DNA-binding GntR family transcriptional regulator
MRKAAPRADRARPRYQAIAADLLQDIRNGRYQPGDLLPSEFKLCEHFGASRHTIREALRTIAEKGLITRRPHSGSMVIASEQPTVFTHSVGSLLEWLRYPPDTYRKVVATASIAADRGLAQLLKCELGTPWFHISSVRRFDKVDLPLAWTDIYVDPKYAAVVKRKDHGSIAVHLQIEKMFGEIVERAGLEIFASGVPAKLARILKVKAGSPALTVIRRYFGRRGGNFETTVTIHPEGRYTYTLDLHRELKQAR